MAAISVMSAHLVSMTDDTLVRANMAALADSAVEQLVCCYQLTSYTPANQSAIIRVSAVTPVRSFQIKKAFWPMVSVQYRHTRLTACPAPSCSNSRGQPCFNSSGNVLGVVAVRQVVIIQKLRLSIVL